LFLNFLVRINGLTQEGGELFVKIFLKRLDKNEVLTTITEEVIKEDNQTRQLKLFEEFQSVETSF